MKNKILFAILLILFTACSKASEPKDLDGDGIADKLSINLAGETASVLIESTKAKAAKKFTMAVTGDCGNLAIYPAGGAGTIIVDQSCSGRQAQVYREVYSWSEPSNTWMLQKTIQGDAIDLVSGVLPALAVQRILCCLSIENSSEEAKVKPTAESVVEINKELELIAKIFKSDDLRVSALKNWRIDMSVELSSAITDKNLAAANDLAYYLWKQSRALDAAIIMEKIVEKNPGRVVALLNFADALWDLDGDAFKQKATNYYKDYNERMQSAGKTNIIPARVVERIALAK